MTERGGGGTDRSQVPEVRRATTPADADAAARIHMAAISEGFLATLGERFLSLLYRRVEQSPKAQLFVALDDQQVTGFVAVADDTRALYLDFLRHDAVGALWVAAPAVARAPRRVWETLRYGSASDPALPTAEILAVAVERSGRSIGTGGALVRAAIDHLRGCGIDEVKVVTASDNVAARRMYEKAGFEPAGTAEVHTGTTQQVLVCR